MKFSKCLFLCCAYGFLATSAQSENSGSFPLLKLAPDARSSALGEAGIAGAAGAMAAFHNPALLAFADQSQAAFAYTDWMLDLYIQSGALLLHYPSLSVGLSFGVFTTPGIERRDLPADNPIETFAAHDMATGLSVSYCMRPNFSLGITGRFLFQQIYVEDASGAGLDLGAAYHFRSSGIKLAAVLRNVGKMGSLQEEKSPLPASAGLGAEGQIIRGGDFGLTGLADAQFYFDDDLRFHAGLEGNWKEHLYLRGGYQTGSELRSFSGGAGLNWNRYAFDYAYQPLAEDFGASHRFTLSINF